MRTSTLFFLLPMGALTACAAAEFEAYYDEDGVPPTISGVSVIGEDGNVGGQTVVIQGSNFGESSLAVTVMFGDQNAEIVDITDSEITVISPRGPLEGGPVDVAVGTISGFERLEGGYSYTLGNTTGDDGDNKVPFPERTEGQIAYVTIANTTLSCLGGIHDTDGALGNQCQQFAYTGQSGITGQAEGYEFTFPRAHLAWFDMLNGFGQRNAISWNEWTIMDPPQSINPFDLGGDTEDQRIDVGEVTLRNRQINDPFCVDLSYFGDYRYTGGGAIPDDPDGRTYDVFTVTPADTRPLNTDFEDECPTDYVSGQGRRAAQFNNRLRMCETQEYDYANTHVYEASWLSGSNFFQGSRSDGGVPPEVQIPIEVSIPNLGIEDFPITLPAYAQFESTLGDESFDWIYREGNDACPDGDDPDRVTSGDDPVYEWRWIPADIETPSGVSQVNHFVTVNVSLLTIGWFGSELPIQATITVPDNNNFDPETGYASVALPASVFFALPTNSLDFGFAAGGLANELTGEYIDPSETGYGQLTVTVERITEYTIEGVSGRNRAGERKSGDLVIAYATGDVALWIDWTNPLDSSNPCSDCQDNDGDGWVDLEDPDCLFGENPEGEDEDDTCINGEDDDEDGLIDEEDPDCSESGFLSEDFTCNDSVDNDGDGEIDSLDVDCVDALSGESSQCINDEDDDGDGWVDDEDPGCSEGLFEDGEDPAEYTCNDGLDNDGDGWIDGDDPACTDGLDEENDGFNAEFECNDGLDNDFHGDIDSEDLRCVLRGAGSLEEPVTASAACSDGLDNDSDGFIDRNDPDCELGIVENFDSPTNWPRWDDPILFSCYNNSDDDGDGLTDAQDPGCIGRDGLPDGFSPNEAAD
ncbi:MAG: IPT/TIG domain-containing protein [Myxococcota bacterium]